MINKLLYLSIFALFTLTANAQCDEATAPQINCLSGLTVTLFPLDSDGDGQVDVCIGSLWAVSFNDNSTDDTTPADELAFYFDAELSTQLLEFDGNDIGQVDLDIYCVDQDGCVSSCSTFFFVESPDDAPCQACESDTEAPFINNAPLTVGCFDYQDGTAYPPTVTDNCDTAPTLSLDSQTINNNNSCEDANYPEGAISITQAWTAYDAAGNNSSVERVVIVFRETEFTFPTDINWSSTDYAAFPNIINPTPLNTELSISGSGTVPFSSGIYCNYAVSTADEILEGCGSEYLKIIRTWTILDWCTNSLITIDTEGNDSVQEITVGDGPINSTPTADCVPGLVIQLQPMDTDGDGQVDECSTNIFAETLNASSSDNETPTEELNFYFGSNPDSIVAFFYSADTGLNNLTLTVSDSDGCFSSCETTVFVESTQDCSDAELYLQGNITTYDGAPVKDVTVKLGDLESTTNAAGEYLVDTPLPQGASIMPTAVKDFNLDNGVTATDLILIRQHILTIDLIDNPAGLIAADVNNNGVISASDLVAARKVILGTSNSFPNNKSWRVFYGDLDSGQYTEFPIILINNNQGSINWTAVKTGDVNGSANPQE